MARPPTGPASDIIGYGRKAAPAQNGRQGCIAPISEGLRATRRTDLNAVAAELGYTFESEDLRAEHGGMVTGLSGT